MTFTFCKIAYINELIYCNKNNSICAILDTGATRSIIGLGALSYITGYSVDIILREVEKKLATFKEIESKANIANGQTIRLIEISLSNISIDNMKFEKLFCRLSLDDKAVNNTNILIGLDIIRQCKINGDKNKINLTDFNYDKYIQIMSSKYNNEKHNIINIFEALEKYNNTSIKIDKQAAEALLINRKIQQDNK